jgi:hypothetical protein
VIGFSNTSAPLVGCGVFSIIGKAPPIFCGARRPHRCGSLSMLQASPFFALLFELLLAAFLVRVIMGVASRRAPGDFASPAIG